MSEIKAFSVTDKNIIHREQTNLSSYEPITTENYHILYQKKYTIPQLKIFLKLCHLKLTGNKTELLERLYQYYKTYKNVVIIQKKYRGYLQRRLNSLRGESFMKRGLCVNVEDFLTLENVKDIPYSQYFSYKTNENVIYGFNIMSIYNIISKSTKNPPQNPYNRSTIPKEVIDNIYSIVKMSKVLKCSLELFIPTIINETLTEEKRVELRALDTFQYINSLGNYSEPNWFLTLSRNSLFKLYRELYDIWNYRSSLSDEMKMKICSPTGNPFMNERIHYQTNNNIHYLQFKLLNIFDRMIYSGIDDDSRTLGAYYVLASLTLVSSDAANSMPWLYQSVSYN